jgi:hypothetical protein
MTKIIPQQHNNQTAIGKLSRLVARPGMNLRSILGALDGAGCNAATPVEVFMPATLTLRDALLAWAAWKSA